MTQRWPGPPNPPAVRIPRYSSRPWFRVAIPTNPPGRAQLDGADTLLDRFIRFVSEDQAVEVALRVRCTSWLSGIDVHVHSETYGRTRCLGEVFL